MALLNVNSSNSVYCIHFSVIALLPDTLPCNYCKLITVYLLQRTIQYVQCGLQLTLGRVNVYLLHFGDIESIGSVVCGVFFMCICQFSISVCHIMFVCVPYRFQYCGLISSFTPRSDCRKTQELHLRLYRPQLAG